MTTLNTYILHLFLGEDFMILRDVYKFCIGSLAKGVGDDLKICWGGGGGKKKFEKIFFVFF